MSKTPTDPFWTAPENLEAPFSEMHEAASDRVRLELRSSKSLTWIDEAVAERAVTLYFLIRQMEAKTSTLGIQATFGNQRNHKELLQQWQSFVALHRRAVGQEKGDPMAATVLSIVANVLDKHDKSGSLSPLRADLKEALAQADPTP